MIFWDSSALVPLIVEEPVSKACRRLRRAHPSVAVWALTRVEMTSAIQRLGREGSLSRQEVMKALERLEQLAARWTEIEALGAVRERSERVLGAHALTAADAVQLGAALTLVGERPRGRSFVTADERLAAAAEAEGFHVIVPQA